MACTPLNIQNGLFLTNSMWTNVPSTTFDGGTKTVTLTTSGPNPGLSVAGGSQHIPYHSLLSQHTLRYMVIGDKYVLILDAEAGTGTSTRRVSLVNFATWSEVPILDVLANSGAVTLPVVQPSPGNAAAFLAAAPNGTELVGTAIHRSDTGAVLCSLGASIVASGQTIGEATDTQLKIHYAVGGTSQQKTCPKPLGKCAVSPASSVFPDVKVGGCVFPLATRQFAVKNVGDDCLTVTSVGDSAPFTVQATSKPLPVTLAKNEAFTVTVAFAPTGVGTWNTTSLPVTTTPAIGDSALVCTGKAVAATYGVGYSATSVAFGNNPVGAPAPSRSVTVTNSGSRPLQVSVAPLDAEGFACAGFNGTLACGQSQPIALSFTPPSEGAHTASLVVTTDAGPQTIVLTGSGCVANATIVAPSTTPIDFGTIEQGFRSVRFFEVVNAGDGLLTFDGVLGGASADLFGLPEPAGSITAVAPSRAYSAPPLVPCGAGPAGSGKALVAVSCFADQPPGVVTASLEIRDHNATNLVGQTWTIPLTATITPPVALDVGLVVDRSGSMGDPLGGRVKLDAAVSASQLFVELLRPDFADRVSIVRFNHEPEVVQGMVPVSATSAPTQADIRDAVATGLPPATGATAIAAGARTGANEVQSPHPANPSPLKRALVVLSDGIENVAFEDPPGSGAWTSILGGDMAMPGGGSVSTQPIGSLGVDVYTVGLGTSAQISAPQLTALAGDPQHFRHVDADLTGTRYFELEKYFTQIFMDTVGTASVVDPMFWIAAGDTHEIEFDVLRGDVHALVVVFDHEGRRLPFTCVSPAGEVLDPATVPSGYQLRSGATEQARLVEFKLPQREPERYAGRWVVRIEHPGQVCTGMPPRRSKSRGFLPKRCGSFDDPLLYGIAIGVGSNFRMAPYVTPVELQVGDPMPLTAVVTEAGLPVVGCTVTATVTDPYGATKELPLLDDGANGDGAADDGEYGGTYTLTSAPGTYHVTFRAEGVSRDGEHVVREAFRDKPVIGPGGKPPTKRGDDPCRELLEELREHGRLLGRLAKARK